MKIKTIIASLILSICLCACSAKKMATNVISEIATDGMAAVEGEEDVELARESALSLIKTLEVLRYGNLKNRDNLVLLSKAYGQYAFAFLEEDMLRHKKGGDDYERAYERAELFYRRGREFGIAALIECPAMRKAFKSPFPTFEKSLKKLSKRHVAALFWTAFNWAGWLNLNADDPTAIVDLPRIEAMTRRAIELDPDFFYGSAHALIATLAASRPKMLGGDPELALNEYNEAIKIASDYLMTKVLFAQYYARQIQDEGLFEQNLNAVLNADILKLPEQRLANEISKRRARLLLDMKERLF